MTVEAVWDEEHKVQIAGKTNLPDGMELMITVKNDNDYQAQDKVDVQNGAFTSGWFSQNGKSLSGDYVVEITSPTANVQPSEPKQIIGENGANLYGELVASDEAWGNQVEFQQKFNVPELVSVVQEEEVSPEDKELWARLEEALNDGMYGAITEIVEALPDPDEEVMAVYHYALYHSYGQDGEEEKSQAHLSMIPSDYSGKGAEHIAFTRYQNEHYDDADYEFIPLDEFVEKYYNPTAQNGTVDTPAASKESTYAAPATNTEESFSYDSADFDAYGNYRPVEEMSQEEIRAELEAMIEAAIGE